MSGPRTPRERLVSEAIESWKRELVDLGGQNRLLYYRQLRVGTLDLSDAEANALDRLLRGGRVRATDLYGETEARQEALKRCRAIAAKARENDEERGIPTLYLAFGMATWRTDRPGAAKPNAPVMLQPLMLKRIGSAAADYELSLDGEPELNPTLRYALSSAYQINVDEKDLLDPLPVTASERQTCVDRLSAQCGAVPDFTIINSIVVGNFSYAKQPMVHDLEEHAREIEQDTLLAAIAGDSEAAAALKKTHSAIDFDNLVPVPSPTDEFIVLDADSSQSWAIAAAVAGANLVIEGPPGTGKSQTIANLIATLVARGKSVLFVAEKRAAIDAVVHRLNDNNLGHLILDLHRGASDRSRIAKNMQGALREAADTLTPNVEDVHRRLNQNRDALDDYRARLHSPSLWGPSAFECQERLLAIPTELDLGIRFDSAAMRRLTRETIRDASERLRQFVELGGLDVLTDSSEPHGMVFHAGRLLGNSAVGEAVDAINHAHREALPQAVGAIEAAVQGLELEKPTTMAAASEMAFLLRDIETFEARCASDIWDADLGRLAADMAPAKEWWAPFAPLRGSYRNARATVRALVAAGNLTDAELWSFIEEARSIAARWDAMSTRPSCPKAWVAAGTLQNAVQAESDALERLRAALGVKIGDSLDEARPFVAQLAERMSTLFRFPDMHSLHRSLADLGLESVIESVRVRKLSGEHAAIAIEHAWLSSVLERVSMEWPRFASFDSSVQESVVREFTAADREHINVAPARVRRAWASRSVLARDEHPHESQVLSGQAIRQRGHMTIRELYSASPHVLTSVKPCWVMSPLVVAQVLPARKCFDVVVFDEASQIPPADAVPTLLRGRQVIVAGDSNQLPPTAFFVSATSQDQADGNATDGENDDDEPDAESQAVVDEGRQRALIKDMESLLDQMRALLPIPYGTRTLSWHYRSRCERLITFSNAHIYEWGLTTFPSAVEGSCVQHVLAPFTVGEVPNSSAAGEVREVVRLILEHASERPTESLGVIALGVKHADRIQEQLREALSLRRDLDAFFEENGEEPFFIKNLERVQGDERDAIVLTTGYSKTRDGRMRYAFGPISQSGGRRRLNVAVTRAKTRMTVVSSFTAAEMDDARLRSDGAKMLRDYLLYAESGGTNLGVRTRPKHDMNPFERDVYRALTEAGIPLTPQFGQSGYWIDFAAMHRDRPGEAVLAIETDGARYHSSLSARDADRLRQANLERLGWRFHRIWAPDWFRDREGVIRRAVREYENAIARSDYAATSSLSAPADNVVPSGANPGRIVPTRKAPPDVRRGEPIANYSQARLREVVRWVKSDGRLLTEDELMMEVMSFLGFSRRGPRIVEAIKAAIRAERRQP